MSKARAPYQPFTVTREVDRIDERDVIFAQGIKGRLGPIMKRRVRENFPDALHRVFFPGKRVDNSPMWHLFEASDGPVNDVVTPMPDVGRNAALVKEMARFMGADLVGVCELDQAWVYTHRGNVADFPKGVLGDPIELPHRFAISIAKGMDRKHIQASPSYIENADTGLRYSQLALIATMLAGWLRELGYPARAHTFINEEVLHQPIAIAAGLGELGRNDSVISARFGPGMRLATITTDLPLAIDRPVSLGVKQFCETCKKCADNCPASAISHGPPTERRGIVKWQLNGERCYRFWNSNPQGWSSCGNCLKSCPYLKGWTWYHRVSLSLAKHSRPGRKALLWLDDAIYGRIPMTPTTALGYTFPVPQGAAPRQRDGGIAVPVQLTRKPQ
jgi:ferredoxin